MPSAPPCPTAAATSRTPWRLLVLCALGASLLGFGRLLPAYFVGDDFAFIGRYARFPFSDWPGLFTHTWQAGLFSVDLREIRPLTALAFMIDGRLWGAEAFGFRLTNLVLHAGCAALVGAIAWELTRVRRVAVLATLIFAFHPVTVPAVGWITGRVDVLSTLFTLGAALALLRWRLRPEAGGRTLAALGLGFAAALFTKESALVFAGLAPVLDFTLGQPHRQSWRDARTWQPYLVLAVVLAAYASCRYLAFGVAGPAGVGRNLQWDAALLAEAAARQVRYAAHLFSPAAEWLAAWRDGGFSLRGAVFARVLALGIGGAAMLWALAMWLVRRASLAERRQLLGLGVGWYLVTTLPLLVTYFSARHLYLTAAGPIIVVALVTHSSLSHWRAFGSAASAGVLVLALLQQSSVRPWLAAGERSRTLACAAQSVACTAEPGTLVFIDAPDLVDGAFCWSWAVPHCLRPPFTPDPLDARIVPITDHDAYAYRENWRRDLPLAALTRNTRPARWLGLDVNGRSTEFVISADQVRRAADLIAHTNRPIDPDELWRQWRTEWLAQSPR